jgi:hypothetical protein
MIRHVRPASVILSSRQRRAMIGIGRESGKLRLSTRCSRRSNMPTSMRAGADNGAVLISPCSQTIGLSACVT